MNLRERFFKIHHFYSNPVDWQRARGLFFMNWLVAFAWAAYTVLFAIADLTAGSADLAILLAVFFPPIPIIFIYRFLQSGRLIAASYLFVALCLVATLPFTPLNAMAILLLTVPLVAAGALLHRRALLAIISVVTLSVLYSALALTPSFNIEEIGIGLVALLIDGVIVYVFQIRAGEMVSQSLSGAEQIEQLVRFANGMATVNDENAILAGSINLVRDQLNYTYAQIYLLDEFGNLAQRVRTGLGVDVVSVRENFNIGDANIVSEAARMKRPVTVNREDAEPRRSHLLPAVESGIAIPLLYGEVVMGVLDVQSEIKARFSGNQIVTLTLLANQVATLLVRVRETEMLWRNVHEQEDIANSLRNQIQELRQLGRESISGAWDEYLKERGENAVGFDLRGSGLVSATDLPETLRTALGGGQIHIESTGDERTINIPIMLRGQMLGAMAFAVPKDREISQRQLEMVQNVSERLALSLETRRLFEQSQAQANRERKASETASLLISATDVRAVLSLAADSFNQALGAVFTRIYIQPGMLSEDAASKAAEVGS
jgi:GAF domain-containing protein